MEAIKELEEWYLCQCNDDWEHTYGIEIGTIDNPGWVITVDLRGTDIEDNEYEAYSYGVGDDAENSGNNWLITKLENGQFVGFGGPQKLEELINVFLAWARGNSLESNLGS